LALGEERGVKRRFLEPRTDEQLREDLSKPVANWRGPGDPPSAFRVELEAAVGPLDAAATWMEIGRAIRDFEHAIAFAHQMAVHKDRVRQHETLVQRARLLAKAVHKLDASYGPLLSAIGPRHGGPGENPKAVWPADRSLAELDKLLDRVAKLPGPKEEPPQAASKATCYRNLVIGLAAALSHTPGFQITTTKHPVENRMTGPFADAVRVVWKYLVPESRPPSAEALARYIEDLPPAFRRPKPPSNQTARRWRVPPYRGDDD
jgi:hypothetical protein